LGSAAAAAAQPLPTTPTTPSQPAPVKLQLNKQQLAVAHKMFEEAPTLTREQKALILGFMAGSRGAVLLTVKPVTCKSQPRHLFEAISIPYC